MSTRVTLPYLLALLVAVPSIADTLPTPVPAPGPTPHVWRYKQRFRDGKPVQGPIRPQPTATPTVRYPVRGSLEEIARLADEIRRRKGIYVPVAGLEGTPVPGTELTPTPTTSVVLGAAEIDDNGELLDIRLTGLGQESAQATPGMDLARGNETTFGLLPKVLGEDKVLQGETSDAFQVGVEALGEGNFLLAVDSFHTVRKTRPRFLSAWILEIGALGKLGRFDEAGEVALELDRLFPQTRLVPFVDKVMIPAIAKRTPTVTPTFTATVTPTMTPTRTPTTTPTPSGPLYKKDDRFY